jgi:hypothetical protein
MYSPRPHSVPLWIKLGYSAFMAVLLPVYFREYGPTNFLYFCDVAALFTLIAVWSESSLLVSIAAVAIILPQCAWLIDLGAHAFGMKLTGMTDYMFDPKLSRFTRALSLYHGWLPILLVYLVKRLRYDPRALRIWLAIAWPLMVVCYFWLPKPGASLPNPKQPVNINYVYGFSDHEAQQWVPGWLWLLAMMIVFAALLWWPAHRALAWLFPREITPRWTRTAARTQDHR